MSDTECVFCRILAGDLPCVELWRDAETLSFMDVNPANPGHALVIPAEHAPNLFAVSEAAARSVAATVKRVGTAVDRALAPAGLSIMQANGPGAAQSVPHYHVHVIPRRRDDRLLFNWEPRTGDPEDIEAMARAIRAELEGTRR